MKKILVTGGTVFVSRFTAEYFVQKGYEVSVLNRGTRPQPKGVTLLQADRHHLGNLLKELHFDAVLDITAYTAQDVTDLLDGLGSYDQYVLISSSAVYPETAPQPFREDSPMGENCFWGSYGTDKIAAEQALLDRDPKAYILRPAYLYGPMDDIYREAFVFECALQNRRFYLPQQGQLPLQFFHVEDLCRMMEAILEQRPEQRVYNAGNPEPISAQQWVELCYRVAGKRPALAYVPKEVPQRRYFSFFDYAYLLDVTEQKKLLPVCKPMEEGLQEAYAWYIQHPDQVERKPYLAYIDAHLSKEE